MLTPGPSRRKEDGTKAEIIGSASSPGEHGGTAGITAGQSLPRRKGSLARSRNVILGAWKELIRGEPDTISEVIYMRIYSHIARRVALEPGGPGAKPSAGETQPLDDLSMAENSWAASSKGHASINFEQFKEAWRDMARGFGATPTDSARYDAFCFAATKACQTIGKEQLVKRRVKRGPSKNGSKLLNPSGPHHRGLSLQGSSPTSERKVTPSGESVAVLLTPAGQVAYGFVDDTGTRAERGLADRGGSRAKNEHLQRDVVATGSPSDEGRSVTFVAQEPPQGSSDRAHISTTTDKQLACSSDSPLQGVRRIQPATAEDTAGTSYTYPAQAVTDGGAPTAIGEHTHWRGQGETSQNESPSSRKTESSPQYTTNSPLAMVGGNVYACSLLSSRLWPPAWVKLKDDRRHTVMRGARREDSAPVFARGIFTAPPASFGGQTDIRTPRVNGLLHKRSSASQEALSLQQKLRHHRVRSVGDMAVVVAAEEGRREIQRHPGHLLTVSSSIASVDSATTLTDVDAAEILPREQLQCGTVLDLYPSSGDSVGSGYEPLRGQPDGAVTCIAIDRASGSQGTPGLSMSSQGPSARDEVALVLPCRLCRRRESAMWCSECKAAFCIPCFESLSHHVGSGVLYSQDRDVPEPRRRWGTIDTNASSTLVEGSTVPPGFKSVSVPGADSKEENTSVIGHHCKCERNATREVLMSGRLRLGRTMMDKKLAVLPQNEFETSRFIPAMCFNSGTGGLCSARDLGSIKYDPGSTKVVIPTTQLQLDASLENYRSCGSYLRKSDQPAAGCGVAVYDGVNGVSRAVKTFGRIPVHIVTAAQ